MTFQKGHPYYGTPESARKAGEKRRGRKLSEETKRKISAIQKGRKHHPQEGFRKGHTPHPDTYANRFRPGMPSPTRGMKMKSRSGERHWNWQGGKRDEYEAARNCLEYKLWRRAVFERDSYRCVLCQDD